MAAGSTTPADNPAVVVLLASPLAPRLLTSLTQALQHSGLHYALSHDPLESSVSAAHRLIVATTRDLHADKQSPLLKNWREAEDSCGWLLLDDRTDDSLMPTSRWTILPKDHPERWPGLILRTLAKLLSTDQHTTLHALSSSADYDPLTGLATRALIHHQLNQMLGDSSGTRKQLAVAHLDLDNFRRINAYFGFEAGDRLLAYCARQLHHSLLPGDLIARLGDDDFCLILAASGSQDSTLQRLRTITTQLSHPLVIGNNTITVTCSTGFSWSPDDGQDAETLLVNANAALLQAKAIGKSTIRAYSRDLAERTASSLPLEQALRDALHHQALQLHYQPQFALPSGQLVGLEALARWTHPTLGIISPGQFIPLAEECGLIDPLEDWVIYTACHQAQHWQLDRQTPLRIAVNLSMRHLQRRNMVTTVVQVLEQTGLPAHCLELELTESVLMSNAAETVTTLRALKALGVQLAVDDFGTGYSSLSYLQRFPIDRLKIDQSFVRDLAVDRGASAIVRAIISLGHSLKLQIVAEGVETIEQLTLLQELGCDEIQGFLLCRPQSATELAPLLRQGYPAVAMPSLPADSGLAPTAETTVLLKRRVIELERAEEHLAQERNLLRTLIDTLPDAVFVTDTNGRYLVANQAAIRFIKCQRVEELLGRTVFDFLPLHEAQQVFNDEQRLLHHQQPLLNLEAKKRDPSTGDKIWLQINRVPFRNHQGQIAGLLVILRDITERRQQTEAVQRNADRRKHYLQVTTLLARSIAAFTAREDLLRRTITLLAEQFHVHHAQVFLPDSQGLRLLTGLGKLGADQVKADYRMDNGPYPAIAAARLGTTVLVSDMSNHPRYRPQPYLPATRTELAVPITQGAQSATVQRHSLEYLIDQKVDGLILCVIDPDDVHPVVRRALDQQIPVITQSEPLGAGQQTAFIGIHEYRAGRQLGEAAGRWARQRLAPGQPLEVGIFDYRLLPQVVLRERGIRDGLQQAFGGPLHILDPVTAADPLIAIPVAEQWLRQHPGLRMILGINDATALGAHRAVVAAGRDDAEQFFIGGVDAIDDALAAIEAGGAFQATASYPAQELGCRAVQTLAQALLGQAHSSEVIVGSQLVTRDNVAAFRRAASPKAPAVAPSATLHGRHIGLSVMTFDNPFFIAFAAGVAQEADRWGLNLSLSNPKPLLGVLTVQTTTPHQLDQEDQHVLEGIANQLAVALRLDTLRRGE